MKEKQMESTTENDLTSWCSSHGLITAQRLLDIYKIKLPTEDLIQVIKTPGSFYNSLLMVPMRNVFNGIILQQVRDYQLYAQKLFIDYLLSGKPAGNDEDSEGSSASEDIEMEQGILVNMNDNLHEMEFDQERLVAKSQSALIAKVKQWNELVLKLVRPIKDGLASFGIKSSDNLSHKVLIALLTGYDFKNKRFNQKKSWDKIEALLEQALSNSAKKFLLEEIHGLASFVIETEELLNDFSLQVKETTARLRQMRRDFYQLIVRAKELVLSLPSYKTDALQDLSNRESLFFDPFLGEDL